MSKSRRRPDEPPKARELFSRFANGQEDPRGVCRSGPYPFFSCADGPTYRLTCGPGDTVDTSDCSPGGYHTLPGCAPGGDAGTICFSGANQQ